MSTQKKFLIEDNMLDKIMSGRAILFTGAGFSSCCTNIDNEAPPTAKQLSRLISSMAGISEDDDLMYTSDYYLHNNEPEPLIEKLKRLFTIKEVSQSHEAFCKVSWRRIYTTNYDNTISRACNKVGKFINSISIYDSPQEFFKRNDVCVHINGNVLDLNEDTIRTTFKLSQSSYVTSESFTTSPWYYPFKKDLEACSAIIFVGYSLYDIDIQKILFGSPELKEKTYFIVKEDPDPKQTFLLSKYGHVVPVGIDAFSEHIKHRIEAASSVEEGFYTDAFSEYYFKEQDEDITDIDITKFLLNGIIEDSYISNAATQTQRKPYIINRSGVNKVFNLLNTSKFILVCSELGNGKTIFCKELMAALSLNDRKVYYLCDEDGNYLADVEKLAATKANIILLIEGYERFPDLIKYIAIANYKNIKVVMSARTSNHDRMRSIFKEFNLEPYEINLDLLDLAEKQQFVSIVDNVGYWGDEAYLSLDRKLNIISHDGQGQISNTLLYLFNAPQIKDRIKELVDQITSSHENKKTLLAICLLQALDLPLNSSLISEVSGIDTIYNVSFRRNPHFLQLYDMYKGEVRAKSSIFSLHLLRHHFSPSFVVETLLDVVRKYYDLRNAGRHEREIYKSLLKFSFIEKVLPEKNKSSSAIKYYEELKIRISFMIRDPHYWLQYAMARMMFNNYELAEKYLAQAYSLAEGIQSYDTSYIDNQQARLYLLKAVETTDPAQSFALFDKAHKLLHRQSDDVYKYRQVALYKEIFSHRYASFTVKNKVTFEHACKLMQSTLKSIYDADSKIRYDHRALRACSEALEAIIFQIVNTRQ